MIKKVAIFGDSWARGSWIAAPNLQEELSGLTFQQMFADVGIKADNYSILAGSNVDTIRQMRKLNMDHNLLNRGHYDLIIVFQSDPIRQCFSDMRDKLVIDSLLTLPNATDLEDLCEQLLKNFYTDLEQFNQPILLIGGCAKLCHKYVPETFKTLPMSWTELLVPGFEDNYFHWTDPALHLYHYARGKLKWNSNLADFAEYEKQIVDKTDLWKANDYFSWCHATDSGFKIMFEKIMEVVNG